MRFPHDPACMACLMAASGCGFGLDTGLVTPISPPSFADPPGEPQAADDGLPPTSVALEGRLYTLTAADMRVVQPPGLDGLWERVLTKPLLIYVRGESASALRLEAALGTEAGEQDPCEAVRRFPEADWTENPVFDAGPGTLDTSFGGSAASLRDVRLSGVVDEYGFGWRNGTLDARVDTRELRAALPTFDDLCALVDTLGGDCIACDDGEPLCFELAITEVTAAFSEASFDSTPDTSGCP
jgi:hypothetical protein